MMVIPQEPAKEATMQAIPIPQTLVECDIDDAPVARGPSVERAEEVLSAEALDFVGSLQREFGARREDLLERRRERQVELDEGALPDFLPETEGVRESDWTVAPPPPAL